MVQKKISKIEETEDQPISFLSTFFQNLKDTLLTNVMSNIKENIKDKIKRVEKKVVRNITSYLFFFLGVIYLSISLVLFIEYYFGLNLFWGFLICGLLLMLISLIFKWLANRE